MKAQILCMTLILLIASILGFSLNFAQVPLARAQFEADVHTLALWHFNEGSGQAVYDESAHHNDGTLGPTSNVEAKDPSWTTGFTGQPGDYAISLDDWYDYVNIPDNPDGSLDLFSGDQFTIEFWTYVRQISRSNRGAGYHWNHYLSKSPFGTPYSAYFIYQCSYYPMLGGYFYNTTSYPRLTQCLPPPTYQWVHMMFTYDSQYLRIYFDEVLQSESDVGHNYVLGNDLPLTIGDNLNTDYPWSDGVDCVIDEVRLSSVARVPPIEATIDIDPDTLNLASNGQWISAYVELPEGYDVANIDVGSITLTVDGQAFPVDPAAATGIGDHDSDGALDLMVKFNRSDIRDWLGEVDVDDGDKFYDITLVVMGDVAGTPFEGAGTITIRQK